MKHYIVLTLLILLSLSSYSQSLAPDKIILSNKDTLLCFNLEKSRSLAKTIVHSDYCDSISMVQGEKIQYMDSIISAQKEIIFISGVQNDNSEIIMELKDKKISNLNIVIEKSEAEVRKQKRIKWVAITAFEVVAIIAILK